MTPPWRPTDRLLKESRYAFIISGSHRQSKFTFASHWNVQVADSHHGKMIWFSKPCIWNRLEEFQKKKENRDRPVGTDLSPPQPTITIQFISSRVDLRLRRVVVDANRHVCVCFYLHTDVAARMIVDKMASVTASITASEKSESATKFRIRSRKREDKKKN